MLKSLTYDHFVKIYKSKWSAKTKLKNHTHFKESIIMLDSYRVSFTVVTQIDTLTPLYVKKSTEFLRCCWKTKEQSFQ